MKVAALDFGTNTFLLLIAEVENNQVTQVYADYSKVVRLGQDLNKTKKFHVEALQRADECLKFFSEEIKKHDPDKVLAMATSAARDAENSEELFTISKKYQIPMQIIPGDKEAAITFAGATSSSHFQGNVVVIDIGGGSTELIHGKVETQEIMSAKSFDIGCVRLTEKFIGSHPISAYEIGQVENEINKTLIEYIKTQKINSKDQLVAVAGTPTALAAAELGGFDAQKIDGYKISAQKLKSWTLELAQMSVDERVQKFGFERGRADVIVVGAMTLWLVCRMLNKEEIVVSTRGVRYGVAIEMAKETFH